MPSVEDHLLATFPPLPMPPADRRLILVIDPSLTLQTIIAQSLRQQGYSVHCFADMDVALRALRQGQLAGPALALIRERWWKTPAYPAPALPAVLDGWEALRLLRQREDVRTILLMDDDRVMASVKAQLAGACATLAMPFRLHALHHLVQIHGRV